MGEVLQGLLQILIGAGVTALTGFIFAKSKPEKVALWISKLAVKATFGNEEAADKIEDAMGDWLIDLGEALQEIHDIEDEDGDTNF